MKRTVLAILALAFAGLVTAPAFAKEPNLKSDKGVEKFWQQHPPESAGG